VTGLLLRLRDRLRNDRYGSNGNGLESYARGWNDCSAHIERLLDVEIGLAELRDAPVMDLRVKYELTGGGE
jgi:hypothetical protein